MKQKPTPEEIIACQCDPKRALTLVAERCPEPLVLWFCGGCVASVSKKIFIGHSHHGTTVLVAPGYFWQSDQSRYRYAALEEDILAYREKQKPPTIKGWIDDSPCGKPKESEDERTSQLMRISTSK